MKLIFCPACQDVIKLASSLRYCMCGESFGYYTDEIKAVIGGKAIPLGFANNSLVEALRNRPEKGMGERFIAFVIPRNAPNITKGG
jgi:hypothetical protein